MGQPRTNASPGDRGEAGAGRRPATAPVSGALCDEAGDTPGLIPTAANSLARACADPVTVSMIHSPLWITVPPHAPTSPAGGYIWARGRNTGQIAALERRSYTAAVATR